MPDDEVVITPYRDGPLLVRGPFVLRDQDGTEIRVDRETVALCRCGKSRLRPFCDGTHKLTGFRAPSGAEDRAVVPSAAPDGGRFPRGSGGEGAGNGDDGGSGTDRAGGNGHEAGNGHAGGSGNGREAGNGRAGGNARSGGTGGGGPV